jgi:hypothetical protein
MRGTIREWRVDVTDNHATAWHCNDVFVYIESLPLRLRV